MKVLPFKIPKRPDEKLILQIDKGKRFYDKLHQHEEIQLSYIVSGKGKLLVGNTVSSFKTGDFIALGSNLPHLFLSTELSIDSHMISLFFTKNSFGEFFFENQEMESIHSIWANLDHGFILTDNTSDIHSLFTNLKNKNKFQLFIKLLELLQILAERKKRGIINSPISFKINKNHGERLQIVFDYVMQNFQNEIRLGQVANQIHMSKNAFCRFFKQRTNKTFFQFIAEIRIQHACELIREHPEISILEVSIQSGYNTVSNFNRHFREIQEMNPSEYRKKYSPEY